MFKLIRIENGRMNVPSPVIHEVTASLAINEGQALALSGGKLIVATGKPEFIAMGDKAATDENRQLAVCRVDAHQIYEVPVSAAPTSLKPGDKVTINSNGLEVTATTTNGVVTIENLNGAAAAGDTVIVRIV